MRQHICEHHMLNLLRRSQTHRRRPSIHLHLRSRLPRALVSHHSFIFQALDRSAHNGSGKTTCFVLGMLSRVDPKLTAPQALCICPTRELAIQDLVANPKCSLLVAKDPEDRTDLIITLHGDVVSVSENDREAISTAYLARHPMHSGLILVTFNLCVLNPKS